MKIEILKDGLWAEAAPALPHVRVRAGEVREDLSAELSRRIVAARHGKEVKVKRAMSQKVKRPQSTKTKAGPRNGD